MQAPTKMPRTDTGSRVLVISCPEVKYESVLEFLRRNDCVVDDDASDVPYPATAPGTVIRGLRCRDGLTQQTLAKLAGIPQRHISEMENGKRPIGKKNARLLGEALHMEPRLLLRV